VSRDDKVCKWSIRDAVMKNCAKTTMVMEGKKTKATCKTCVYDCCFMSSLCCGDRVCVVGENLLMCSVGSSGMFG
jgi:hypothetical protein